MLEYLFQYLLFLFETLTVAACVVAVIVLASSAARQARQHGGGDRIEVKNLNQRFSDMKQALLDEVLPERERKQRAKTEKRDAKARRKAAKAGQHTYRTRLFVLEFDGDIRASAVDDLREEINAVLQVARAEDEVLVRLNSAGGMVHTYGLAASQLSRVRNRGIRVTVAVDKVAASGGYMMACVAERIIAAPFAIIGSIGVVGQLPNFNRLLKEHQIDFELHTAGQHKRTLTLFGENSDAARSKFREELDEVHELFKSFVTSNRPRLDIDRVATGEHWYGTRALELGLIDAVQTSDDYLLQANEARDIYGVRHKKPKRLAERLTGGFTRLAEGLRHYTGA